MKKIILILLALTLALTASGILTAAAGGEITGEQSASDDTTVRAYAYDETAGYSASIWFSTFESDGTCTGTDYAVFNCAAPLKGIGLPELYAGRSENNSDCTVRFELFAWDTDANKTLKGTPVFSEDVYFDGDSKELPHFTFDAPKSAGQYLFRITQLTAKDTDVENSFPYSVLPIGELKYSENKIEFDSRGPFIFFIECEKAEGVSDYFLNLDGKGEEIDIQPEKTIFKREGAVPHPIFEFGIVTPAVPDGQVLYSVSLTEAPTWANPNPDSDVTYEVYKWTGDYEESIDGKEIDSGEILDHKDNSNLTLKFGTKLRYGNAYLIVITRSNSGAIGYYQGGYEPSDEWLFYEYGLQLDYCPAMKAAYAIVGDLGPEPTEEPSAAPTGEPATDAPTDAPAVTDASVTTGAPETTGNAGNDDSANNKDNKKDSKGGPLVPVIIGVCAAVIAAAIVIIVVKSKKKK